MFDHPKQELERLQAQLLAAERYDEELPEEPDDDIYDEFDEDEPFDEELDAILSGRSPRLRRRDAEEDVSSRAAGFDADDYVMDTDRYIPAPQKRGNGCLAAFGIFKAIAVIALVAWLLWRML